MSVFSRDSNAKCDVIILDKDMASRSSSEIAANRMFRSFKETRAIYVSKDTQSLRQSG